MKTLKILLIAITLWSFIAKAQTTQPQQHSHVAASATVHHKRESLVRGVSFNAFRASVPLFFGQYQNTYCAKVVEALERRGMERA